MDRRTLVHSGDTMTGRERESRGAALKCCQTPGLGGDTRIACANGPACRNQRLRLRWYAVAASVTVAVFAMPLPDSPQLLAGSTSEIPIALRPYRVCVSVAFDCDPQFTAQFRHATLDSIRAAVRRTFGEMWDLDVEDNGWLLPTTAEGLRRLNSQTVVRELGNAARGTSNVSGPSKPDTDQPAKTDVAPATDAERPAVGAGRPKSISEGSERHLYDKAYVLVVETAGCRYQLTGREWDRATQSVGLPLSRETYERRAIAPEAFALVQRLFRPVTEIDRAEPESVVVRLQAGEFPAPDPRAAQLQLGTVLQPLFRYLDRQHAVRNIQSLPWTYLTVEAIDRARVTCSVVSALRSPLSGRRQRRVDQLAISIRPELVATRLTLLPRGTPAQPLVGYRVTVVPGPPPKPGEPPSTTDTVEGDSPQPSEAHEPDPPQMLRLLSDRWGTVAIPADANQPLVTLYVRSGKMVLARVPFVPGTQPAATIELPGDSVRLGVEGEIEILHSQLIDTVAQRAVLTALARSLAGKDDWAGAEKQIDRFKRLPDRKRFETRLRTIRFAALKAAKEGRDRQSESRIQKLCSETLEIIERHLDASDLKDLENEIDDLRRTSTKK